MGKRKKITNEKMKANPNDQFKDWHEETWENAGDPKRMWVVTPAQCDIVERNVERLVDRSAWHVQVEDFETNVPEDERKDYTVHFDQATIDHRNFAYYCFPCSVSFNQAKFCDGNLYFNDAKFTGTKIDFSFTEFGKGLVSFREAVFGGRDVFFRYAKFGEGDVYFSRVNFGSGNWTFDYCQFAGRILFFKWSESPNDPESSNCPESLKSKLSGQFSMRGVEFPALADFSDREFEHAPDFVGSTFRVPPDISVFSVDPPKMKRAKKGFAARMGNFSAFKVAMDSDDAARYRKLKAMAIATNDHTKELEFLAYELRCKRGDDETKGWASFLNSLFELTSDYGQSIWRPVKGLVFMFLVFFGFYVWDGVTADNAFLVSFYASLPFLKALSGSGVAACANCFFKPEVLLVPLQMLFSLAFLFLFFLGLRNRFKLK